MSVWLRETRPGTGDWWPSWPPYRLYWCLPLFRSGFVSHNSSVMNTSQKSRSLAPALISTQVYPMGGQPLAVLGSNEMEMRAVIRSISYQLPWVYCVDTQTPLHQTSPPASQSPALVINDSSQHCQIPRLATLTISPPPTVYSLHTWQSCWKQWYLTTAV